MKFYSVQLKKNIEVEDKDLELVTLKNGRRAAKATVTQEGQTLKLFRILSKADADRLSQ